MPDPTPTPDPTPDPGPTPEPERTFTQDELNRVVQERLARDRKDRPSDEELAQMRTAQERLAEIEAENQTELEKANARAEKAEQARAEAEQALAEAQTTARQTSLRSALLAEAAKAERGIVDPQGAVDFISNVDTDLLEIDNDGNPVDIAKAMDSLLEKRPYLVAPREGARPGGADQGARSGGGKKQLTSTAGMTSEQIVKARKEGLLDDYLGVSS